MDPNPKQEEPDPRNTLRHLLQPDSDPPPPPPPPTVKLEPDTAHDMSAATAKADGPLYTATTTTTRRNPNGSISSVYSGNKIRHLKKDDGVPLWRNDIQFDFLQYVFRDDKTVFHKVSDGTAGHTFADIYLDAMAKSSKCSKILKDKLLTERPAALNMAMVCLLVNVGRMNTTLNCTESVLPIKKVRPNWIHSLSRDASPAPNLPLHPFSTSPSRSQRLQAASGRASLEVHPQRCHRRH